MKSFLLKIDWWIMGALLPLIFLSLSMISGFGESAPSLVSKQSISIGVSLFIFFFVSLLDLSFLKKSKNTILVYGLGIGLLVLLIFFGVTINGARSWFSFAGFTFQPADLMKLLLILILAKYLARRHVEIKSIKHIFITGLYFLVPFILILVQPDFGSAIILFGIWFTMIMVSGISKKHLLFLFTIGFSLFMLMWIFMFKDYQKNRLKSFIDPLSDIRGVGYNAYQSTIAVGSGKLIGKGVGYGTQSRLSFLPEYETDFIFAAISEEWGFVGSFLVIVLLLFIVLRILIHASFMKSNFELLVAVGVAAYFMTHIIINIGMNIGIMPVTGVTLPFVSYGGSHLLVEFLSLAVLMSFRGKKRLSYKNHQADTFLY